MKVFHTSLKKRRKRKKRCKMFLFKNLNVSITECIV